MCEVKCNSVVITKALECHEQRMKMLRNDIEDYKIMGFDYEWSRIEREIVVSCIDAILEMKKCKSITLNYDEEIK